MRVTGTAKFESPVDFDTDDYPHEDWAGFDPNDLGSWPEAALDEISSHWASLVDWDIKAAE